MGKRLLNKLKLIKNNLEIIIKSQKKKKIVSNYTSPTKIESKQDL